MNEANEYLPGAEEAPIETTLAVVPAKATPLAARDAGIAAYLASSYSKAGTLRLTSEETKILKADFPDDAFLTGAAGKDSLIYVNPRNLRDRMDEALGMGGWSHVSLRTWNEEYKTQKGASATRVYHECVLIVRGVYVCQSVGDMSYYPGNPEMNYGDAYQGSQSHSLRRCLRDFGVGLQAWSKTFQAGWFERHRPGAQPHTSASAPPPAAAKAKVPIKIATANTRAAVLDRLGCNEDGPAAQDLHDYLVKLGWLDSDKAIEQWPYRSVPITPEELEALKVGLAAFSGTGAAALPYQPHGLDPSTLQAPAKAPAPSDPDWMNFIMPYGAKQHKGKKLGELSPEELAYYVNNFVVMETHTEQVNGEDVAVPLPPECIALQKQLRAALDQAAASKKG